MQFSRPLLFVVSILIYSCNRYKPFESQYQFHSNDRNPDYTRLDFWAAHPLKWDPSDSTPSPLRQEQKDSTVDVFFVHPTTLTNQRNHNANALIDDWLINAKTDYTSILYQGSVFNKDCRVFAPRYRQSHLRNFFSGDSSQLKTSIDLAYLDVKKAFQYYLQHWNNGRPIIIAAHSQGSLLAQLLLKEFFDNSTLKNKLVVAYLAGWPVSKTYFKNLPVCADSTQTGCICTWRTFRNGYLPSYFKNEKNYSYATNPLNWVTTDEYAPRKLNKGSVLTGFNKIYLHTTDARVSNGFLFVKHPKFPWSFLVFRKNYHPGDINLYYINIRENVRQRIGAFWKR